jgi:plasmid stabilization system protein ParE
MTRVLVSVLARQDVRDILKDLSERAGHAVASRYAADFKSVYRSLVAFPEGGSPRRSLGADARIKIVYPFVVIYDHRADAVTVLRVMHGHRDITAKLLARSRGVAPLSGG